MNDRHCLKLKWFHLDSDKWCILIAYRLFWRFMQTVQNVGHMVVNLEILLMTWIFVWTVLRFLIELLILFYMVSWQIVSFCGTHHHVNSFNAFYKGLYICCNDFAFLFFRSQVLIPTNQSEVKWREIRGTHISINFVSQVKYVIGIGKSFLFLFYR
jgi:hypothetical protein